MLSALLLPVGLSLRTPTMLSTSASPRAVSVQMQGDSDVLEALRRFFHVSTRCNGYCTQLNELKTSYFTRQTHEKLLDNGNTLNKAAVVTLALNSRSD